LRVLPEHIGPLLLALTIPAELITTSTLPAEELHPLAVTITRYVPLPATVTFEMMGFCWVLVNPLGPDQAYVILPVDVVLAVKFKVLPEHKGLLLEAVGVAGADGLTNV
jgi:hypothetical protein